MLPEQSAPMDWITFGKHPRALHEKWTIFIDVEGFSHLLEHDKERPAEIGRALEGLTILTTSLFKLGTHAYPGQPPNFAERLFMHQFGDGYLVWPDHSESGLERPLLICIALMKSLITQGVATKAALSYGSLSDVFGIYTHGVGDQINQRTGDGTIGHGIVTFTPVLGTALSRAYKLAQCAHGAQLIVDRRSPFADEQLPQWLLLSNANSGEGFQLIDWVNSSCERLRALCSTAGLSCPSAQETKQAISSYILRDPAPGPAWQKGTMQTAGMM